jgi:rRNA-processing protein FCF1
MIVDAANVMGSVPDGWWRDRRAAAARLRDSLAPQAEDYDVVLVVEGAAKGIDSIPGVPVHAARGSGDDAIVGLVAAEPDRRRVVVTADRGLRERVQDLGAEVIGPRAIRG